MTALRPITPIAGDFAKAAAAGTIGEPRLLPITDLCVDDTYQRAISARSATVVQRIANTFDWAKFLPVIVVRHGLQFCIVDGQHRTTAAATIGITEVPAYILDCTPQEAAGAFAAINGTVTPINPVDIWFASLAAGDPETVQLKRVLDAANTRVVRGKTMINVGDTRSVNVLRRARIAYGDALLTTILQCITETGDGNVGMIIGSMVNGIGLAIRSKPEYLAEPSRLFDVFDKLNLTRLLDDAKIEHATTSNPTQAILTRMINAALKTDRAASAGAA